MNKLYMRRITQAIVLTAFTGAGLTAAQAGDTIINKGDIAATISDAGYFSSSTNLGLSYKGNEFVNAGTFQSWYWLNSSGVSLVAADADSNNPLLAQASSSGASGAIVSGGSADLSFSQTMSIPTDNQLAVAITLTNNTEHAINNVQWGVGIDPDQDSATHGDYETINTIAGLGNDAAVSATGRFSGYTVTLENIAADSGVSVAAFIGSSCCEPANPADALAAAQGLGFNDTNDRSISLAYDLGTIDAGQTASFSYAYNMSVVPVTPPPPPIPEPETYAMLLAGLGMLSAFTRRRKRS